ncbi:DEAD/DEAH box helicase family protein [Buchananella felis]|uniref:restriction endonuclease n=1 Tax=Buchananella felis TaxID=3231492 RepID=UPI00352898ED
MSTSTANPVTLEHLLDRFYFGSQSQREKGDKFERLVRAFLMNEPEWIQRFSEVWLWSDWPGRAARPDTGIDLVAVERATGELCAIQCKFYSPDHVLSKPDLDSFLAASSTTQFASRLIVSTTDKWNRNAEQVVQNQNPPVGRIGLSDLSNSRIDWSQFSFDTPEVMELEGAKELRPHQRAAIEDVLRGFESADRGKLIMACGTGKTFTSLKLAEQLIGAGGGASSSLFPLSRCSPRLCGSGARKLASRSVLLPSAQIPR